MILTAEKSVLSGEVTVPASKSHTIRALTLATLARGKSVISNPLDSADTRSCVGACRALGAEIHAEGETWTVQGAAGQLRIAENVIDVENSGTTLYIALGMAALVDGWNVLTGDRQTRRRTALNLIEALNAARRARREHARQRLRADPRPRSAPGRPGQPRVPHFAIPHQPAHRRAARPAGFDDRRHAAQRGAVRPHDARLAAQAQRPGHAPGPARVHAFPAGRNTPRSRSASRATSPRRLSSSAPPRSPGRRSRCAAWTWTTPRATRRW